MTLTTPYVASFAVGDGETREFPYTFDELNANFIQVRVYNVNGTVTAPTFIPDVDLKKVVFGEESPTPTADDVVCIFRQTPVVQDTPFRTLEGYNAKALENILSKIVAMIQEVKAQYVSTPAIQGEPWQLELLTSDDDGATLKIDYVARRFRKGLYFQIVDGNLQVSADGSTYITMPKSVDVAEFRQHVITLPDLTVIKKLQYRVGNEWFDAEANAQATADEALSLAQTVQGGLSSHVSNVNNPHQTNLVNLKDTNITSPVSGQFIMFDGAKWKNVYSSAIASWGTIIGNITDQTDLMNKFTEYVRTDGSSTMTNPLMMRATEDFKCAIAPYWDGIGFFKLNDNNSVTLMASIEYNSGFEPATTNTYNIGASARKWKNLYLSGKAYVSVINNGYDIAVPVTNSADTLALKSEVDLAANSGRMITDQGVWYAKMYAATVAPSAENGTNYADFSQVDGQGDPIIVIYERQNGAWVQSETITPPAEYDGYVPITSKIWDIAEQAGQQGGRILWNHQSKEFTPYPQIISFENIEITGISTVIMPQNPSASQIVNKDYVDNKVSSSIGNGTITITQGGETKGSFTTNQDNNTTIDLDAGGGGSGLNVGDIFLTMRNDNELNGAVECDGATYNTTDFTGAQSIGQLLADGKVPYVSMATYATEISTKGWCDKFGWDGTGNIQFKVPTLSAYVWQKLQLAIKGSVGSGGGGTYFVATGSSFTQQTYPGAGGYSVSVSNDQTIPGASVNVTSEDVSQQRCMVQLATSASDEALETCTGVLADVAALKYDYVVDFQRPTAANNYTWYRKYKSGWVEQGGRGTLVSSSYTANLPVTMADTEYFVFTGTDVVGVNNSVAGRKCTAKTTTTVTITGTYASGGSTNYDAGGTIWQVNGMAQS